MTANEPRDLVFWMPEASECSFGKIPDCGDGHTFYCDHPAIREDNCPDTLFGYGATPEAAYAAMLVELRKWQKDEEERRYAAERKAEYDRGAPDCLEVAKGRMED